MTIEDADRKWMLAVAWGELRTPEAIDHVQIMRANDRWRNRDPELAAALDGGLTDPDWEAATRPNSSNGHQPVEADPDTQAAWSADHPTPNLPGWFWEARPVLTHIRHAAWSRLLSPDAVLCAVLARVAAAARPQAQLPAIVGARSSLAFYGLLCGPPGTGKSSAIACASDLLDIASTGVSDGLSLGSGEGLIELYMGMVEESDPTTGKNVEVKRQVRHGAFVTLDEGTALAEMGRRRGATLLPNLRSMWTGGAVGQANASVDTRRQLASGTYSLGFLVGIQPSRAAELLADDAAGTPQRFVWARSIDPSIPPDPVDWPQRIAWTWNIKPRETATGAKDFQFGVDDQVSTELRTAALARNRGETVVSELDAHADLLRLKVAGLLAALDSRRDITPDDWALGAVVVATSAAVRTEAVEVIKAEANADEDRYRRKLTGRDDAIEQARDARDARRYFATLEGAAKSIAHRAAKAKGDGINRKDIHAAIGGRRHKVLGGRTGIDDAIAYAIEQRWLAPDGDRWVKGSSRPEQG